MKRLNYIYEVYVELEFSEEEIEAAIYCSENHYDHKCRSVSTPGPDSFLNGIRNQLWVQNVIEPGRPVKVMLSTSELDLLVKILEPWSPSHCRYPIASRLYFQCIAELGAANRVWGEVNEKDKTT